MYFSAFLRRIMSGRMQSRCRESPPRSPPFKRIQVADAQHSSASSGSRYQQDSDDVSRAASTKRSADCSYASADQRPHGSWSCGSFQSLLAQGVIHGRTSLRKWTMPWHVARPAKKSCGEASAASGMRIRNTRMRFTRSSHTFACTHSQQVDAQTAPWRTRKTLGASNNTN